jgi:hypothetical protein
MKSKNSQTDLIEIIKYKLSRIETILLKLIGSLTFFKKYQLINRLTTFKKYCTQIESFPNDEEAISKDWYLLIRPSEAIERKLPICLDEDNIALKKLEKYQYHKNPTHYRETPEIFLSCINQGKLISRNNSSRGIYILSSEEDYVFSDVLYKNYYFLQQDNTLLYIMCPPFKPKLRYYPGEYCLLTTPMSPGNYYHWILEILPRLSLLEEFHQLENIPLIVHKNLKGYQKESLEIIGMPKERVVYLDNGYYQVDKIYYPSYLGKISSTPKENVSWVRKNLLNKYYPQECSSKNYVYISRRDAGGRRVLNEEEIVEFLKPIGFEIVVPGKMSLKEQITTFRSAQIIISPHGAALANMVFAPPNSTIIEMIPETKNQIDGSYNNLANSCGHQYAFLTGSIPGLKMTDIEEILSTGWDDAKDRSLDFYVSLDKLKALLEKVVGNLIER